MRLGRYNIKEKGLVGRWYNVKDMGFGRWYIIKDIGLVIDEIS